jgi:hypothetical protein
MGLVVIAHYGSYMATGAPDLCSASVVLFCRATKKWLKASATERSPSASNYLGKLLGAIMFLLILRTVSSTLLLPYPPVVLYCNNRGVINHGNSPLVSLPKKQHQADLIPHIKHLTGTSQSKPLWE